MLEARLAVAVAGIGTFIDGVQTTLGLLVFHVGQPTDWLAPFWMAVLWMLFAITLRYALWCSIIAPWQPQILGILGAVDFHPTTALSLGVLAIVGGGSYPIPSTAFPTVQLSLQSPRNLGLAVTIAL